MSQPENTKAQSDAQQVETSQVDFANQLRGDLLRVNAGVPADDALYLASTLANGLRHLHEHLAESINYGEELGYMDEQLALSFLAETIAALVGSVRRSLSTKEVAE